MQLKTIFNNYISAVIKESKVSVCGTWHWALCKCSLQADCFVFLTTTLQQQLLSSIFWVFYIYIFMWQTHDPSSLPQMLINKHHSPTVSSVSFEPVPERGLQQMAAWPFRFFHFLHLTKCRKLPITAHFTPFISFISS